MLTYEKQKAEIATLNMIDDQFFQEVVQDIEICEEILRIILQMPNLKVLSNQIERRIPNLTGHAVTLDLICEDENGNIINVEVQKANDTNHQKRVRYNIACIDTMAVKKGTQYHELPDVYVVFISAFDMFKRSKTTYHIHRHIEETGDIVENGTHEIYVNTKIDDGSDIAQLMQYFKNSTGFNPLFKKLSRQIHFYKETPEGVKQMSNAFDRYADAKVAEQSKKSAIFLLKEGVAPEIVAQANKLSLETVLQLQEEIELQNA